jgi:hypothetical protein
LLGSDLETDNKTTFIARQQILNKQQMSAARNRLGKHVLAVMDMQQRNGVFYMGHAEMLQARGKVRA